MKTIWSEKEIEFLEHNYEGMHYKEIGILLKRSYKSVSRKAEELGLKKKENRLWTKYEEQYLIDNYNRLPAIKIAENLNRTYNAILNRAESHNLYIDYRYCVPSYNELFFDKWSDELAWFVGIILSDGCVFCKPGNKFIKLSMCDRDALDKIKKFTMYTNDIIELKPEKAHYKILYQLTFHGNKVWQFFRDLGMDNDKSHNAIFPTNIQDEFIPHIIRGIFDGDGSISLSRKTGYPSARICGTKNVVDYITDYVGIHNTLHPNSDINYTIQYTGERALQFLNYIYKDSIDSTRMDRKYNKYLEALQWSNNGRVLCK